MLLEHEREMNDMPWPLFNLLPRVHIVFKISGMAHEEYELDRSLTAFEKMLTHDLFKKSIKQVKILKYLFTMTVEGRAAEVSEYSLAYDALGMGTDFDPTTNASIRVELSRLRKKLKLYQSEDKDLTYHFSIETGEYLLTIKRHQTHNGGTATKNSRKYISTRIFLPFLGILMFAVLAFYGVKKSTKTSETFRPSLRIVYDISDINLFKNIDVMMSENLVSDNFIYLTDMDDSDYVLEISNFNNKGGPNNISIKLRSKPGRYIFSKTIKNEDDITKLVSDVNHVVRFEAVQSPDAVLPRHFDSADWVDERRQLQFRCVKDSENLRSSRVLVYFSPSEVAACLADRSLTSNKSDILRMNMSLVDICLQQARGYYDAGIEDPLSLARRLLSESEKAHGRKQDIFEKRIYLLWVEGVKSPEAARALISEARSSYGGSYIMQYMISMTESLYLGDVEASKKTFSSHIPSLRGASQSTGINAIPLSWAVAENDIAEIEFWIQRVPVNNAPYLVWDVSAACKNSPWLLGKQRKEFLADINIYTKSQTKAFIDDANYHPGIANWIKEGVESCRDFP